MLKAYLSPGFNGCGRSTRIMVLLIVCCNGAPAVVVTPFTLNPALKSETRARIRFCCSRINQCADVG